MRWGETLVAGVGGRCCLVSGHLHSRHMATWRVSVPSHAEKLRRAPGNISSDHSSMNAAIPDTSNNTTCLSDIPCLEQYLDLAMCSRQPMRMKV